MKTTQASYSEGKRFQIKGTVEFANRTNLIFSGLNELEERHGKWKEETPMELGREEPDALTSCEIMDCKTETFKRPRLPLSLKRKRQCDNVPDYIMNPHKWKKYSLANTPSLTEESNTAIALQFLKDLKKNREEQVVPNVEENITYSKPTANPDDGFHVDKHEPEKSFHLTFACSSVHKMPELVVGEKRQKTTKPLASTAKVGISIKLDHLEENLDEV